MKLFPRKLFLPIIVFLLVLPNQSQAQVKNMALQFEAGAFVDCGSFPQLDALESYTLQFWFNGVASGTEVAQLVGRGNGDEVFSAWLATDGSLKIAVGKNAITASSASLPTGEWHQVSLIVDKGEGTVLVDGKQQATATLGAIPACSASFAIGGGGFEGRIDDVRLWNIAIPDTYDYFIHTTLNEFNPYVENLIAYYKMDQADCPHLVDYKHIWAGQPEGANNHGLLSAGACKVEVTDNPSLPYILNSAYTANERFWDRDVKRGQYLISNDIIILGIQSYSDGHLKNVTPNCHGRISGGEYLTEWEGRKGVMSFDGNGKMEADCDALDFAKGFTFQAWIYIDEWVDDAYIFRNETDDQQHGISIRLGGGFNDKGKYNEIIVRINGKDVKRRRFPVKQWAHLAIEPNGVSTGRDALLFFFNGTVNTAHEADAEAVNIPLGAESCPMVFAENFKGKMDDINVWKQTVNKDFIQRAYNNNIVMPAIGNPITADQMFNVIACYLFDNPDNPGWDSYSQDNWREIIRSAYDGYTGYKLRISVKSHSGWESTISSAARRKIFAADLAKLAEGYDGVELDLEWMYGTQTTLGYLAQDIREALPADKSFYVSCHNVAYGFPASYMKYVDGFTFQQYGPQNTHFRLSHFKNMVQTFINYGFPKNKIVTSYSTTTSQGFSDSGKVPIRGVKDGFMPDGYESNENESSAVFSGYTFWFTDDRQTYRRAEYTRNNGLAGIFYWDMGNDMPINNEHNLARNSSYAICGNVDPYINKVKVDHDGTGISLPTAETISNKLVAWTDGDAMLRVEFLNGEKVKSMTIMSISGACIGKSSNAVSIDALASGVYVVSAYGENGSKASVKYIKK